jgi:hypothetical protein
MGLKSLWAVFGLLLCACVHSAEGNGNSMRTIVKANTSGIQDQRQVAITNRADWEKLWTEHTARMEPKQPAPAVDFNKETVVVVTQGQKTTGGYGVEITDVTKYDGKAMVTAKTRAPKPGAITLQALTSPIHIVAVPKIAGKVEFKVE